MRYLGIDFGKKQSFTVLTAVEYDGQKAFVRMKLKSRDPFDVQFTWISNIIKKLRPSSVNVDKTGLGIPLEERLVSHFPGLIQGIQFSSQTKEKLVMNALQLFSAGRIEIPDDKDLKDQLHGIEKEILDSGRVKLTGKRSETDWLDDEAWSLFLACLSVGDDQWSFQIASQGNLRNKPKNAYDAWVRDVDEMGNSL